MTAPAGDSTPLLLGAETERSIRSPDLAARRERLGASDVAVPETCERGDHAQGPGWRDDPGRAPGQVRAAGLERTNRPPALIRLTPAVPAHPASSSPVH